MQKMTVLFLLFFSLAGCTPVLAESIRVIDGDSLRLGSESIRLIGIDAPELKQTCQDQFDKVYNCGQDARSELRRLIGNGYTTVCSMNKKDKYGRNLAYCKVNGLDVGRHLVRHGYAVSYITYDYLKEETYAYENKIGIWRGEFETPSKWRKKH